MAPDCWRSWKLRGPVGDRDPYGVGVRVERGASSSAYMLGVVMAPDFWRSWKLRGPWGKILAVIGILAKSPANRQRNCPRLESNKGPQNYEFCALTS